VYIPKNEKLRLEVIQLYYNILVVEHEGRWKITELVIRNHWWPGVMRNVRKYVDDVTYIRG